MNVFIYYAITAITILLLTFVFTRALIPRLKSLKLGQKILDIGPRWHKSKEGTPTMGGLAFILAAVIVTVLVCILYVFIENDSGIITPLSLALALALANGAIGIVDDLTKFKKSQNEGLTASQKYLLQLLIAGFYLLGMRLMGFIDTTMKIPFIEQPVELGVFYYAVALLVITGIVNSVNLTDGIDGLASSTVFVAGGFFTLAGIRFSNVPLMLLSGGTVGSTLGFLSYNYYPAKIFMGDTGSLFLGGMLAASAFLLGSPLIILIAGFLFVIEALSVIIQVGYFKLSGGKRIFKMAPLHHHFEKSGWSEIKIVYVFSAATLAFCVVAWFGL